MSTWERNPGSGGVGNGSLEPEGAKEGNYRDGQGIAAASCGILKPKLRTEDAHAVVH